MAVLDFLVTNAGLALAANAATNPTVIKVDLTEYRLGSESGYPPDPNQTDLKGDTLFSSNNLANGGISYASSSDGGVIVTMVIPAEVGGFTFGEDGIYTPDGTLFAIGTLPSPGQPKYSSLNQGNDPTTIIDSTVTFNCYIKLAQGTAIFNLPPDVPALISYVPTFSAVVPQGKLEFPLTLHLIVRQTDSWGRQTSLLKSSNDSSTDWSVADPWTPAYKLTSTKASTTTSVTFEVPALLPTVGPIGPNGDYAVPGAWLVQTGQFFRLGSMRINTAGQAPYTVIVTWSAAQPTPSPSTISGKVAVYTDTPGTITTASLTSVDVVNALGYVPVNKTGDTMDGPLNVKALGVASRWTITVDGNNDLVFSYGDVTNINNPVNMVRKFRITTGGATVAADNVVAYTPV